MQACVTLVWLTAVTSIGFLWGLKCELCFPSPILFKAQCQAGPPNLSLLATCIPFPPSVLRSCPWPFALEGQPSDLCGYLGSSLLSPNTAQKGSAHLCTHSVIPRPLARLAAGAGNLEPWVAVVWPRCVAQCVLWVSANWPSGPTLLSAETPLPPAVPTPECVNMCGGAKQHPFLTTACIAVCAQNPVPGRL